jgi:hypothetical protein
MRIGFTPAERIQIAVAIASRAVALATLVLAAVTIYMARETKRVAQATEDEAEKVANQASSTKEQASISAASLRASIRPWLTKSESAQAAHVEVQSTNHLVVSLRILNVGPGIALIPPDGCIIEGGGVQPGSIVRREGQVDKPVLSRGRDATVAFDVERQGHRGRAIPRSARHEGPIQSVHHVHRRKWWTRHEGRYPHRSWRFDH